MKTYQTIFNYLCKNRFCLLACLLFLIWDMENETFEYGTQPKANRNYNFLFPTLKKRHYFKLLFTLMKTLREAMPLLYREYRKVSTLFSSTKSNFWTTYSMYYVKVSGLNGHLQQSKITGSNLRYWRSFHILCNWNPSLFINIDEIWRLWSK